MEKCADCGRMSRIDMMTTSLTPLTDDPTNEGAAIRVYVCNRCGDWYHNFGIRNDGECAKCGFEVYKSSAFHRSEDVNEWGYFTCNGCKEVV
jgi:ribosomal protein L37E